MVSKHEALLHSISS